MIEFKFVRQLACTVLFEASFWRQLALNIDDSQELVGAGVD